MYIPASQPQLGQRPELSVVSRKQLQPNQQRITFSISGSLHDVFICSFYMFLYRAVD